MIWGRRFAQVITQMPLSSLLVLACSDSPGRNSSMLLEQGIAALLVSHCYFWARSELLL
jgi:hypothetical protein